MNKLISIIIPVYNCDKYIDECLNSVCKQTIKNIEIICIDDGSIDNSFKKLKAYAQKDNRIIIYKQPNLGAGVARNLGLEKAKGEFVCFLDADDYYLDKNALAMLYNSCIENKVKVTGSVYKLLQENKIIDDIMFDNLKSRVDEVLDYVDFQFDFGYTGFLFCRQLLIDNNISFPAYRRYEDPPFLVQAMYHAKKFVFKNIDFYCYRMPTIAREYSKIKARDILKGLRDNLIFAKENQLEILFNKTVIRLEYELFSILTYWINKCDIEEIHLLEEIQDIIRCKIDNTEYQLRPLSYIQKKNDELSYEESFIAEISNYTYIYIYGAGKIAKKLIFFLKTKNLLHKVKAIVISEKNNEIDNLEGIKIKTVDSINNDKASVFYIATGGVYHKQIIELLEKHKYNNINTVNTVFFEAIVTENKN